MSRRMVHGHLQSVYRRIGAGSQAELFEKLQLDLINGLMPGSRTGARSLPADPPYTNRRNKLCEVRSLLRSAHPLNTATC